MNNALALQNEFNSEQLALITNTVAKGATKDELQLFLYRCKHMGLDPLKPGQVHFVKYGNNPGTIIIGIDGFRSKAAKTGKHTGTKRGVIRDEKGVCVGAWCEVFRSDWTQCAREEVSL
jgi:recombination protein RecT